MTSVAVYLSYRDVMLNRNFSV